MMALLTCCGRQRGNADHAVSNLLLLRARLCNHIDKGIASSHELGAEFWQACVRLVLIL